MNIITTTTWAGSRNSHPKPMFLALLKYRGRGERAELLPERWQQTVQVFMLSLGTHQTEVYSLLAAVKAAPDMRISKEGNQELLFLSS